MHKGVYALVDRLRRGLTSRNRHFAAFADPLARRAQRLQRQLAALEREVAHPSAHVRVELALAQAGADPSAAAVVLVVERPEIALRHVAYLRREELAFLCEAPLVRVRLGSALDHLG